MNVIESEEFAKLTLDKNANSFVIHARQVLNTNKPLVHRDRRDRIVQARSAVGTVKLPPEYNEYSDVFSNSDAAELSKHGPADHAIDLIDGKQPPYDPIYNLNKVELETLRGYIESNLANGFIRPSTLPAGSPIPNRYPPPLVEKSIDRLAMAKTYSQLDLTAAYHRLRIKKGD